MKKLGIGISDFKELIEGNYIYVDKTKYIYKLIQEGGSYYFLSRPRRFGKSLLLSTIRYLFENHKDLFKNLYIYELKDKIYLELKKNYLKYPLQISTKIKTTPLLFEKFEKLITKLSKKINNIYIIIKRREKI
jgi:hypothetical protein